MESPSASPSTSPSPSPSASPSEEFLGEAIDTTVGSATANSYVTVDEANTYIAGRYTSSEANDWASLTTDAKEMRLVIAANLLSSLPFMGVRASVRQAMAWPRLFPRDELYKKGTYGNQDFFETYEDVEEAAEEYEVTSPGVPNVVKYAQIELAWQVVHKSLFPLETGETSTDTQISSIAISGGFSVTIKDSGTVEKTVSEYLGGKPVTSLSYIQALLAPYLTRVRWRSV